MKEADVSSLLQVSGLDSECCGPLPLEEETESREELVLSPYESVCFSRIPADPVAGDPATVRALDWNRVK